jgi:ABC-type Fe3+ transport system permease subunit
MTLASLGPTDLPSVGTMVIGIVVLLMGVVAFANWRMMWRKDRSSLTGAGVSDDDPRHRPWREMSPLMRVLLAMLLACWAVALVSLCTVGFIETVAVKQPEIADAEFVHPHNIKGVTRFFTDRQERIYAVAKPLMIGFGAAALVLMVVLRRADENWRGRKQRDLLDRLTNKE